MPMHDWTRVEAGIYHDFHNLWLVAIRHALNHGVLPKGYYALTDQRVTGALGIGPDVLALKTSPRAEPPKGPSNGAMVVAADAPATRFTAESPRRTPRPRQKRVAVRHVSTHQVVALIELVSPGNKSSARDFRHFLSKVTLAVDEGVHLLVIDPFPPTARDPHGVHAAIWKALGCKPPFVPPPGQPLTLAAYSPADGTVDAYIEPFAVGGALPDMPLFLTPDEYVRVPLEAAYAAAWAEVPDVWRDVIAG